MLICPYKRSESGDIALLGGFEDTCELVIFHSHSHLSIDPNEPSEDNVMGVFDVVPGDNPDLGGYASKVGRHNHSTFENALITYSSYVILKQVAPSVNHVLSWR